MQKYLRTEAQGADTVIWLAAAARAGQYNGQYFFDRAARGTSLPFANTEPEPGDEDALAAVLKGIWEG
jgi:hypothetical protein